MQLFHIWQCLVLLASTTTTTTASMSVAPSWELSDVLYHGMPRISVPEASICPHEQTAVGPGLNRTAAEGIDQTPLLYEAMRKRQSCPGGYAICNSWPDLCCPDTPGEGCCVDHRICVSEGQQCCNSQASISACDVGEQCCLNGCAPESATCCAAGNYHCNAGNQCCDNGGCAPEGAQCCQKGLDGKPAYCNAGNNCYEATDLGVHPNGIQCCTDSACTAYVADDGTTSTLISTAYYTFTYTWYYYAYYFTINSEVTSTLDSTETVFSVLATDDGQASSKATVYAASVTAEGPPAAASTQLATYAQSPSTPTASHGGGFGGEVPSQTSSVSTDASGATVTVIVGGGAEKSVVLCLGLPLAGASLLLAVLL